MKNVDISVGILNKGCRKAEGVSVELRSTRDNVKIIKGKTECGGIDVNEIQSPRAPFTFFVTADSIEVAQFEVIISESMNRKWTEFIEVAVMVDYPEFTDIKIADGLKYTVAAAGTTKTSIVMGIGNGDGVANPGESIIVLVKDNSDDLYRRMTLYTSDRYVNPNGINRRLSDYWGSYDHVGGSHKISMPLISSDCPVNHVIEFFSAYWLPDYPDHIIKRGTVKVEITGHDTIPPQIRWAKISGNNVIQVKVFDGGKVDFVNARLKYMKTRYSAYPHDDIEVSLKDDGTDGDILKGDNVFSVKIPEQKFGLFTVEIETGDSFGNKSVKNFPDIFTVY